MKIDGILNLTFQYAGALIDANRLVGRGWRDMTGSYEGGEWVRYNSTWVEYVETREGLEYRIECALGTTCRVKKENGFMAPADGEYSRQAHEQKVPRLAFFRCAHAWVCDNRAMTFGDSKGRVPDDIVIRVAKDIANAVIDPAMTFVDDISYQTVGLEEQAPERKGNAVDRQFYILSHVIAKEMGRGGVESVARLLAPFARVMLTEDDIAGRRYAETISEVQVIEWIVTWARESGFPASAVAVLPIARNKTVCDTVTVGTWVEIVRLAIAAGALEEAADAMEIAFARVATLAEGDEKIRHCTALYWAVVGLGNDCPDAADGFDKVVEAFGRHVEMFGKERLPKVWVRVARCWVRALRDEKIPMDEVDGILSAFKEAVAAYDEDHREEAKGKPGLLSLPEGVKAPLEWQAMLFSAFGDPDMVLRTFPTPPSFDERTYRYLPAIEPVEGLSFADVWEGFEAGEWSEDAHRRWSEVNRVDGKEGRMVDPNPELIWLASNNDLESYRLVTPAKPEAAEISSLRVQAKSCAANRPVDIGVFPYLPREFAANLPNVVVKVWRYHVWRHGGVADVGFETASGQRLTAVMPYFISDYTVTPRGERMNGLLVGFAHVLRRLDAPETPAPMTIEAGPLVEEKGGPVTLGFSDSFYDYFNQDVCAAEISRAGFGLQGRVRSMRNLKAFGIDMLAVEIACGRLDEPLRVYIAAARLETAIAVGDTVEAFGWLYLDLFDEIDAFHDFKITYPVSGPIPRRADPWTRGVPTYVRTEYTEEERKKMPVDVLRPNWLNYGHRMLEACKDVVRVETCPANPLGVNYLVKTEDRVEKFKMVIVKDGETPCIDYPGVRVFVLRLTAAKKGWHLSWEGLPEKKPTQTGI